MEVLIRTLKVFVVVGGIVLVFGTAYLLWLLATRDEAEYAKRSQASPAESPENIQLPVGSTIRQMVATSQDIYLLLKLRDGGSSLARIDMNEQSGIVLIPVNNDPL